MSARTTLELPLPPTAAARDRNGKHALKGRIHEWLQEKHLGWSRDSADAVGKEFLNAFTEVLWYIDGHKEILGSRGCNIPTEFIVVFFGYNVPEKSKHRKKDSANLSCDVLNHHAATLNHYLPCSWMKSIPWMPVREMLLQLSSSLSKYANYLNEKNKKIKINHLLHEPVRNILEFASYTLIKPAVWVKPSVATKYAQLVSAVSTQDYFSPVYINDFSPVDARYVTRPLILITMVPIIYVWVTGSVNCRE